MPENTSKNPKQDQRQGESGKPQKADGSDTTVSDPNRSRKDPSKLPSDKGDASDELDFDDFEEGDTVNR